MGVCRVIYVMKITIEINVNSKTGDWSITTLQNGKVTDDSFEGGGNVLYDLSDEVTQGLNHELINHGLMTEDGDLRKQTFKDGQGTLV